MLNINELNQLLKEFKPADIHADITERVSDYINEKKFILEFGECTILFDYYSTYYVVIDALNMGVRSFRIDEFILGIEVLSRIVNTFTENIMLLVGPGEIYFSKLSVEWNKINLASPNTIPSIIPNFRFKSYFPDYQLFTKNQKMAELFLKRDTSIQSIERFSWLFETATDGQGYYFDMSAPAGICFKVYVLSTIHNEVEVRVTQPSFDFTVSVYARFDELEAYLLNVCNDAENKLSIQKILNPEKDEFTIMSRVNKTLEFDAKSRLNRYNSSQDLLNKIKGNISFLEFDLYKDEIKFKALPLMESNHTIDVLVFGDYTMLFKSVSSPFTMIKVYKGPIDAQKMKEAVQVL